jgi:hypothetical protein
MAELKNCYALPGDDNLVVAMRELLSSGPASNFESETLLYKTSAMKEADHVS